MNGLVAVFFVFDAMIFHSGDGDKAFWRLLAVAALFALLDIADAVRSATRARKRARMGASR